MLPWIETVGTENFRAVWLHNQIVAGLGLIWMGQWFGGRRVPMVGITAVGVAPDQRGSGIGTRLLHHVLEEIDEAGYPLSALYPATLSFYQRSGYARAGQRITYELPLAAITIRDHSLALVPIGDELHQALVPTYEQRAKRVVGNLDRPTWMWKRILDPQGRYLFGYLVMRKDAVEGYVVFTQGRHEEPLNVRDVCVLTPDAGRRILTLLAGYRSTVEHVTWNSGYLDSLVYLLKEPHTAGIHAQVKVIQSLDWMLRLVDVSAALSTRGYPPGLTAELHFEVHDGVLPSNNGRFVLHIANEQGQVSLGGQGRIRLGVRELAAMYSGFMAPVELCAVGAIEAPLPDLALASSVFAGARPWIADMF